jgi:hypothetical protein
MFRTGMTLHRWLRVNNDAIDRNLTSLTIVAGVTLIAGIAELAV